MAVENDSNYLAVSGAIIHVDSDWKIKAIDSKVTEITDLSASQLVGMSAKKIFCEREEFADMVSLCKTVLEGGIISNLPVRICGGRSRKPKSFLATILPLPTRNNEIKDAVICLNDSSKNGDIQQRIAMTNDADGVFTTDINLIITSFNKSAETLTGWSKPEVIGRPCHEILRCSECNTVCLLKKSITDNILLNNQSLFIKNKNGTSVPVYISTAPLFDDHSQTIGGIVTLGDSTFSLQAKHILNSIADGVFTVDLNWKITSFNKAAETITGWPAGKAIGQSCSEVFHSSICGRNCAIAESLYSGMTVTNRSTTITNLNGEKIPLSISASPLSDHNGNIIGGVQTFRDLSALTSLRKQLHRKYRFDEIVSKSKAMQRLFAIMPEVACSPSTVLVYGESGTGKELIARALYNISDRKDKPFVAMNCGAIPETLLESELFGYMAGAFTDARKDKPGRLAAAEGGTLFLDEIGDIPKSIQVKLLRVLQEKKYEPLGSNTPVKTDVRIITATNRDLKALVQSGRFREDLYYRLNVVRIHLPPLRERKEDIPLLISQFVKEFSVQVGKDIAGVSNPVLNILMRHDYPGNIRELKNIIEYAFILCEGGFILPEHLPAPFDKSSEFEQSATPGKEFSRPQTLEEMEKQAIYIALEKNNWKKVTTCEELGISKDTLRRKVRKYKLEKPIESAIKN